MINMALRDLYKEGYRPGPYEKMTTDELVQAVGLLEDMIAGFKQQGQEWDPLLNKLIGFLTAQVRMRK